FHLANSAAIWKQKEWKLTSETDRVRPGLSLYGVVPWPKAQARGLSPVMSLKARVIAVHTLQPGDRIGYGGTFKVPEKNGRKIQVAVLSAGYEDGIHRTLSGKGHVMLGGRKEKFLGRISMDLCTVSCGAR